jgi:acetyl-CoA carboxylase carboxyltransferase component
MFSKETFIQWSENDNLEAPRSLKAQAVRGGGARRIERQYSRGMLTDRERIEL